MELGRAVLMYGTLAHATREGARFAIVRGSESSSYRGDTWEAGPAWESTRKDVELKVKGMATGFGSAVTVTTTWDPASSPGCVPDNKPGCVVRVRSEATFTPLTTLLGLGPITMSATSQMVISF